MVYFIRSVGSSFQTMIPLLEDSGYAKSLSIVVQVISVIALMLTNVIILLDL